MEIKPCPFCGKMPILSIHHTESMPMVFHPYEKYDSEEICILVGRHYPLSSWNNRIIDNTIFTPVEKQ